MLVLGRGVKCDARAGEALARGNPLLTPLSRPLICSENLRSLLHPSTARSFEFPSLIHGSVTRSLIGVAAISADPLSRLHSAFSVFIHGRTEVF